MPEGRGGGGAPHIATESIAGLRPYQEDAVVAETLPDGRTLLAVADGMGGHAAGEVASALALETLRGALREGVSLSRALHQANHEVHEKSNDPDKHGMGTTLVAAILDGDECRVANVGDSRCYVIGPTGIRQVTEDHSFVREAIRRGQPEEVAMASQWRDALTRSIGTAPTAEVDELGPFPLEPDTVLLLCSDGLYKTLSDRDIADIVEREEAVDAAARVLVASALEQGSDDNITVAIARTGSSQAADSGTSAREPRRRPSTPDAGAGMDPSAAPPTLSTPAAEETIRTRRILPTLLLAAVLLAALFLLLGS